VAAGADLCPDSRLSGRNVAIGRSARAAIAKAGAQFFLLPPYSPDMNPIEMAFAKLKTLLRQAPERTIEGSADLSIPLAQASRASPGSASRALCRVMPLARVLRPSRCQRIAYSHTGAGTDKPFRSRLREDRRSSRETDASHAAPIVSRLPRSRSWLR